MSLVLLDIACVGYLVFAVAHIWRRKKRGAFGDAGKYSVSDFVLAGIAPIITAVVMTCLFMIVGVSPTVQFNAGSSSLIDAWSLWLDLGRWLALLVVVSTLGGIVAVVVCLGSLKHRRHFGLAAFSLTLSILVYVAMSLYAPTA